MLGIEGLALLLLTGGLVVAVWRTRHASRQASVRAHGFRQPGIPGSAIPRKGLRRAWPRRLSGRDRRPVPPRLR
ncbi:MAG: hypothetical protein Q9M35_01415 [Rhodothermus sp.]|nr:hypothetical protein [Rhodothermus sp.]